ncbi:uncharacterized protein LOC143470657 [Clavelina lepadiformis]|uniref:uncharacterized protein LOC143470657 n=1 Tax=Clavelina lepadiformis TaxID=159417 RepID=UPI004042B2C8
MSSVLTNGDYCLESGLQVPDLPLTHAIVKEEFVTLSFGERTRLMNFLAEVLFRETETQDLDSIPCAISEGMLTLLEDDTDGPFTSFSFASANDSDISLNVSTNSDDVSSNQSISHAPTGSHAFNKVSSSCCFFFHSTLSIGTLSRRARN